MARILGALPRSVIAGYLYSSEFMGGPQLAQMARIFSSERRWSRLTSSGERPARGFPSLASMLLSVGNGGSSPLGAPLGDFGLGGGAFFRSLGFLDPHIFSLAEARPRVERRGPDPRGRGAA